MPLASPFPSLIAFALLGPLPGAPPPLTPEEEQALGPATSARRRAQFALGRACARAALRALGVPEPLSVGRGANRQPVWPQGIVGSITHSHDQAAAAAARGDRYRGIGIDLEQARLPSSPLLHRVCRPPERERLEALGEDRLRIAFTAVFAAKESVYKALHPLTGVYLGFQDAEIEFAPTADGWTGGGAFTWKLEKDSGPGFPPGSKGQGAWRRQGDWVLAGVWIDAP
jgi:4'-phosphopantetheinyl transferase EntD